MRTAPLISKLFHWFVRMLTVTGTILMFGVSIIQPASAAGDDYLKALDEEAGTLEFLGRARKEQEQLQRAAAAQKSTVTSVPVAGDRVAFERQLQENFPASYSLYIKMKQANKDAVFTEYSQSRSPGIARFNTVLGKIITISSGGG
jgi:hypothetical protein